MVPAAIEDKWFLVIYNANKYVQKLKVIKAKIRLKLYANAG
jgi:hypothetical protein